MEAIVEGTSRILAQDGYESLTTNRIAEVAGVSIGSFYQYFPGKQAVIAEISKRLEHSAVGLLAHGLSGVADVPLRLVAKSFVEALASRRFGDLQLRRELLRHVPRRWTEDVSLAIDKAAEEFLAEHLAQRSDVREGNHQLMAFTLVHAIEAVVEAAVLRREDLMDNDRFINELTELVIRYISK